MGPGWIRIAALAVFAASAAAALAAGDDDSAAWRKDRQSRFALWRTGHPDTAARLARLKSRTRAALRGLPSSDSGSDSGLDRPPVIWRIPGAPDEVWDGADFPKMIVIPAGEYTMGSPPSEPDRQANEDPRHRVRIGYSFAVSQSPVLVGEYARFVADTGYDAGQVCYTYEGGQYQDRARSFRPYGLDRADSRPAVCLSWNDAQAYIAWLSKKTGHAYRLLSEAEYEYVNRAGTVTAFWWGDAIGTNRAVCDGCGSPWDKKEFAPAGSFAPNPFGLYDTTGNGWSWTADCWNDSYAGAPADGSANRGGDCSQHVMRGGSWVSHTWILRSARRQKDPVDARHVGIGFRVARML